MAARTGACRRSIRVNQRFYVVSRELPTLDKLTLDTRQQAIDAMPNGGGDVKPYQSPVNFNIMSNGFSIIGPPWSTITAYDMNSGKKLWTLPNGEVKPLADLGLTGLGSHVGRGNPVVTGGGLLFNATSTDRKFRARDSATGKILWEADLPAASEGIPAVYEAGGRQFIVIPVGGDGLWRPSCRCPRQAATSISPLRSLRARRRQSKPSNAGSCRSGSETPYGLRHFQLSCLSHRRPADSHRDNIIARSMRRQGEGTMNSYAPSLRTLVKSAVLAATALGISMSAPVMAQRGAPPGPPLPPAPSEAEAPQLYKIAPVPAFNPPKTSWGEPDFRGGWPIDSWGSVNLQRTPAQGNRVYLTDAEAAAARGTVGPLEGPPPRTRTKANKLGMGNWVESFAVGRRTSLLIDPPDGRLPPLTPYGRAMERVGRSSWVNGQTMTGSRISTTGTAASRAASRFDAALPLQ